MTLQGKTALVTGGGRDIGRSVSIALARAGVRVAINYNSGREAAEDNSRGPSEGELGEPSRGPRTGGENRSGHECGRA